MKEHHDQEVIAITGVKPKKNQINLAKNPKYADKLKEMEGVLLSEIAAWTTPIGLESDDGLEVPIIKERVKPKQPRKPKNQ